MLKKVKVYIAGPFFNESQVKVIRELESIFEEEGVFEVYSPSRDGIKLDISSSTHEDRLACFNDNVANIKKADIVLAVLDGYDTGTWWELAVAEYNNKSILLVVDSDEPNVGTAVFGSDSTVTVEEVKEVIKDAAEDYSVSEGRMSVEYVCNTKLEDESEDKMLNVLNELHSKELIYLHKVLRVNEDDILSDPDSLRGVSVRGPKYSDLLIANIDDRGPIVANILGRCYAEESDRTPNIVTCTNQEFGVNIMLMHSIAKHCTSPEELRDYVLQVADNNGEVIVDDNFARNAKDFE